MKYLKEAALKTNALYTILVSIILSIVYLAINARILIWVSDAVTHYEEPMYYINLVIIGCVINIIISMIRPWFQSIGNHQIYTYLYNKFSEKVLYSDYDMFTKWSPGEIITTSESLWLITRYVILSLNVVQNALSFIITLIAIGMIEYRVILPIVIVYCIAGVVMNSAIKRWNKIDDDIDNTRRKRNRELDEIINGFTEIRSFYGVNNTHNISIHKANDKVMGLIGKRINVDRFIGTWFSVIDTLVMVGILVYSVLALNSGVMTASATAVTLVMYGWRLIDPLAGFVDGMNELSSCKAPMPKFEAVMDYENKVSPGHISLDSFDSEISFQNVNFSYDSSSHILQGLNLTIKKGQHIGICGATGCGKSTLLKLIPKFYDVDEGGAILIDGIDIRKLTTTSLRKHIGIVHQNPYIFDGTIGYNIKYAGSGTALDLDREVTDSEMIEAAKKAQIYDFIMSLPNKFDTQVGPRGLKLSGGQKQRIALARLFISSPEIILLDEATSALDNETEAFIQDSLNTFKDKTMIVVAHRLSSIKDSDKIVVIDKHQIIEEGTHVELLEKNGVYATMYNK